MTENNDETMKNLRLLFVTVAIFSVNCLFAQQADDNTATKPENLVLVDGVYSISSGDCDLVVNIKDGKVEGVYEKP